MMDAGGYARCGCGDDEEIDDVHLTSIVSNFFRWWRGKRKGTELLYCVWKKGKLTSLYHQNFQKEREENNCCIFIDLIATPSTR